MSCRLTVRRPARDDIREARTWYEGQREGLGEEFLAAVEEALERLRQTPEMHQVIYRDVRRRMVQRFPYGIYYRVLVDRVVVIAVVHGRRDPKTWQSRA